VKAALALPFQPEGPPADVIAGLELLARSPPLWPISTEEWSRTVASVRAFAERWDASARAAGWRSPELYRLHRRAPYARLDAMGAAWLLAQSGDFALAVDAATIVTTTHTGNRLRIYRTAPIPEAMLAWTIT
jgi:hypothetical protein